MTEPVNLENLREMTGGDKTLEKELFDVFLSSSEECLRVMFQSKDAGQEETWRTKAHAWKGMSLNLGADHLGALCAQAQLGNMASTEEKAKMLGAIADEYEKVKAFLAAAQA